MTPRIGYFVRTDQAVKPGGDLVQARAYLEALGRRGFVTRLISRPEETAGLEVVHVFNLDRPWDCLPVARAARAQGCTVVLSPIAHPQESVRRYQRERSFPAERLLSRVGLGGGFAERLKAVARGLGSRNAGVLFTAVDLDRSTAARELWGLAAGIQLLSTAERAELERQGFSCADKAAVVVRNGVDPVPEEGAGHSPALEEFLRAHPRFAVVGGRVEPRKNQVAILEATRELDIPLVVVGHLNERHAGYCQAFRRALAASPGAHYAGGVSRQEFGRLLRRAHLHVSASLFEVSPLVDLEARAVGCHLVTTEISFGTEFLDEYATLCDPWSPDSLRAALRTVWARSGRAPALSVPAWDDTADPLLRLYSAARPT